MIRKLAAALCCGLLVLLVMPALFADDDSGTNLVAFSPGGGGPLAAGAAVPAEYRAAIETAARTCPQLTPSLLAGQIKQESGWNPKVVSPVGAQGMAQFMPGTWSTYGLDGNGDGKRDPFDPFDAIPSMAAYDCQMVKETAGIPGNTVDLMLAGYNAGPAAVVNAHGIPPYRETQQYIANIKKYAAEYAAVPAPTGDLAAVVAWAQAQLGTSYVYGGDCTDSRSSDPSKHCDCSSLLQQAYRHGAGIELPRTTFMQLDMQPPIPRVSIDKIAVGDLLYPDRGHVGMYIGSVPGVGDHVIIHAPRTGRNVEYNLLNSYWSKSTILRPSSMTR